ncbi:MAG: HD domain-containing protein [Geminicoccaceae bacterium]
MANGSIEEARQFARRHHDGQKDKLGIAYVHHVEDVARRVAHLGRETEIIAWLHDVVEDTDVSLDEIEARFGAEVRAGVDAMTKRRSERYLEDYLPRLQANQHAVAVKIADATHNWGKTHLLQDSDPQQARTLGEKYSLALERLGADRAGLPEKLIFKDGNWIAV